MWNRTFTCVGFKVFFEKWTPRCILLDQPRLLDSGTNNGGARRLLLHGSARRRGAHTFQICAIRATAAVPALDDAFAAQSDGLWAVGDATTSSKGAPVADPVAVRHLPRGRVRST